MRVFYRSSAVLVTDRSVQISGSRPRTVAIDEIDHVYVIETGTHVPGRVVLSRSWPAISAVVLSAIVAVHNLVSGAQDWMLVGAVALLICGVGVILAPARVRPVNELWVVMKGAHVCLFRDADRQIFGQVQRALIRAREYGR